MPVHPPGAAVVAVDVVIAWGDAIETIAGVGTGDRVGCIRATATIKSSMSPPLRRPTVADLGDTVDNAMGSVADAVLEVETSLGSM